MNINLLDGERIDDLERNGYRIIQNKNGFCFGMDVVLLSGFVSAVPADRIIDLGTGTGIIPILLHAKTGSMDITGLEIQEESCDMARRSVLLNDLGKVIKIVHGDICKADEMFGRGTFDVVTSNPPYMKSGGGLTNQNPAKAIARHEVLCTFKDIARQTAALLKKGGRFYLVHRPERLAEILDTLKDFSLEPKRLRMVHSFADSDATMFLLEAILGGNSGMKVEKPLIIYKEKNVYTDEICDFYGF
ncbi:MAG: tRNA1(Val) (adenine(37)-N6)-methyltransferase [Lachnospiraceae bacterium]|jgi:tRNA1Val (adenine37-N6)-methyltransferase